MENKKQKYSLIWFMMTLSLFFINFFIAVSFTAYCIITFIIVFMVALENNKMRKGDIQNDL